MTTTTIVILPGEVARCADITLGLVGLVEHLNTARHQIAPGSQADVNLQHALKSLASAHAALNATAMLDAIAAHDARNQAKPIPTTAAVTPRDGIPH